MDTKDVQKTNPFEKPLFVLRYVPWRIVWRLFIPIIPIGLSSFYVTFAIGIFKYPSDLAHQLGRIVAFMMVIGCLWVIYDMLGMEGVYLYKDQVIKRYRWGRENKVILGRAKYNNTATWFMEIIAIFDESRPLFLRSFKDVFFDGMLAAPRDVKKFKEILSEIARTKIEDLDSNFFPTKLIQKEDES